MFSIRRGEFNNDVMDRRRASPLPKKMNIRNTNSRFISILLILLIIQIRYSSESHLENQGGQSSPERSNDFTIKLYFRRSSMTINANVAQKAARRKQNFLELAREFDNVSSACMIKSYSRQQFYEIRRNFQT